jgi:hypothetical protein
MRSVFDLTRLQDCKTTVTENRYVLPQPSAGIGGATLRPPPWRRELVTSRSPRLVGMATSGLGWPRGVSIALTRHLRFMSPRPAALLTLWLPQVHYSLTCLYMYMYPLTDDLKRTVQDCKHLVCLSPHMSRTYTTSSKSRVPNYATSVDAS